MQRVGRVRRYESRNVTSRSSTESAPANTCCFLVDSIAHSKNEGSYERRKKSSGFIGAGGWAKYGHIPALQSLEEFEIVAVSSRKNELAEEYAAKFNIYMPSVTSRRSSTTLT
jgi:hypothetical protein